MPAEEAAAPAGPAVEVDSVELAKAYADNEVAAQAQYGNSPLIVSGTIKAIELDMMDKPVVVLPGTDEFTSVQASFGDDAAEVTAGLKKGEQIKVRCASVTEVMGSPMLDDCAVE